MPPRLPGLLAAPPRAQGLLWLFNAKLFDGTSSGPRNGAGVLVQDGVIARVGEATDAVPDEAVTIDL